MNTKRGIMAILFVTAALMWGCASPETPDENLLAELTIAEIHTYYSEGTYSVRQITEGYLARIEKYNSRINALTTINRDALREADRLDREYRKTKVLRPLHGIPVIVKDNINTSGMPTTAGSLALKNYIPSEDAFIIRRLKEAGAIVIAKSNMAEWAFSPMHTESSTAGTTCNPYNTDYVPAGSSGGTAAAIAAGLGVIGLGTDTGNSIRGPASHCALVGFRSTQGLVSRSAIVPLYLRNDVVGPICRTVEDATRVLEVIAGYDADDPITSYSEGRIPDSYISFLKEDGLKGVRIGVLRILSENRPDSVVKELFENALKDMELMGATIVDPFEVEDFQSLRQNQWCADFRKDVEWFLSEYVKRDTMKTIDDIIRVGTRSEFAASRLKQSAGSSGRYGDTETECLDIYHDARSIAFREAIERAMDSLRIDVIVYPTWNNRPATIEKFSEQYRGDNNQVIAPHTGQPAFTVPMGFLMGNLPAGIQFLGRMYDEGRLISIAYAYEQATGHRKPPPREE